MVNKRKVAIIGLTVAILSLALIIGATVLSHNSDSYTLVGDGYSVVVTHEQFEQFGKGEFADLDLDRFVAQFNLKKVYDEELTK